MNLPKHLLPTTVVGSYPPKLPNSSGNLRINLTYLRLEKYKRRYKWLCGWSR